MRWLKLYPKDYDSKKSPKRAISDKILKNRVCEIIRNPKYGEYQKELTSRVCKFLIRKKEEEVAQKLQKPVINKLKKGKSMPDWKMIFGLQI